MSFLRKAVPGFFVGVCLFGMQSLQADEFHFNFASPHFWDVNNLGHEARFSSQPGGLAVTVSGWENGAAANVVQSFGGLGIGGMLTDGWSGAETVEFSFSEVVEIKSITFTFGDWNDDFQIEVNGELHSAKVPTYHEDGTWLATVDIEPTSMVKITAPSYGDEFMIYGLGVYAGGGGGGIGSVPEPGTVALLGLGAGALALARRRRRTRK